MGAGYVCINSSLFSHICYRGYLLDKIDLFVHRLYAENVKCKYYIEFNNLGGDNIRFSLLVPEHLVSQYAYMVDVYFKKLFLKFNVYLNESTKLVVGVFMPFPQNTIQYGLYRILGHEKIDDQALIFEFSLSNK